MNSYELTAAQRHRLAGGVAAVWRCPFIDDIEDFVWEALFHYAKGFPVPDPLLSPRTKRLFDAVDVATGTGWSLKALQRAIAPKQTFELVIQRADVVKKRAELGFPKLTLDSPPDTIGAAILAHWKHKVDADRKAQKVEAARVAVLLKSVNRKHYAYMEQDLHVYKPGEVQWQWTNESHQGLQALCQGTGAVVLKWYHSQKQLFECFTLDDKSHFFDLDPKRLSPEAALVALSGAA